MAQRPVSVLQEEQELVVMLIYSLSSISTHIQSSTIYLVMVPLQSGHCYHSKSRTHYIPTPYYTCLHVQLVFLQTRAPPAGYLPDRHCLPLLPCTVTCTRKYVLYSTCCCCCSCCCCFRLCALNRSTLTGPSLPCYPLQGPSPPDLDRSLPVKSGCPQSPSASDPPPG